MINEQLLVDLGFTNFIHLSKDRRDGKRRMVWNGEINQIGLMIVLAFQDSKWELEKLKIDEDNMKFRLNKLLPDNPTIDDVITLIKEQGALWGIGE